MDVAEHFKYKAPAEEKREEETHLLRPERKTLTASPVTEKKIFDKYIQLGGKYN